MNMLQDSKFNMYLLLKITNDKFRSIWEADEIYNASYSLWVEKLPKIEQNRDAQILETSGVTTNKISNKVAMIDKALFIAKRIQSYSNVNNNVELLASVQYSATKMKNSRENEIIGYCNTILAKAIANAANIEKYGVTNIMIADLKASITAFLITISLPKAAQMQTRVASANLIRLFKEADDILTKRLDLDIEVYKITQPEFYNEYKTVRIIKNNRSSNSSVLGKVLDAQSGEVIKSVNFLFMMENNGSSKPLSKKSTKKGNFQIKNLMKGSYKVVINKIGYKEQIVIINILTGETTHLKIELEKI